MGAGKDDFTTAPRIDPAALARLLDEHKDALLSRWARRVLSDPRLPSALPLSKLALYDHLPDVVARIAATLRGPADNPETLGKSVGDGREAQDHVRDRANADYSVPEVLRELSHLRLAIVDLCEELGRVPDATSLSLLHSSFDQMMVNAADELSKRALEARQRAEALALEREALYERERAAREASEDAHRAKDQFLAMVSHELRTPLSAIAGWCQLLELNDADPSMRARAVTTIQRNADAQAKLIESVLDVSRLASGRVNVHRTIVDLAAIVKTTLESFNPAALAKRIRLELRAPEAACNVSGDELRLRQIIANIVGNAVKFTPDGGTIHVELTADDATAKVDVRDTGPGIAQEFLPHVFEPFRQADASWTRQHGGLGLGMAIAKALVELHGGTIAAASDGAGKGTTFSVRLPRTHATSQPAPTPIGRARTRVDRLKGVRVLLVDDVDDARDLACTVLTSEGAALRAAASAREARDIVAGGFVPDVLLTDVAMPQEDGISLLHALRAAHGRIPAVAMSAFTAPNDVRRIRAAGFDWYVTKPFVVNELLAAVAQTAGRETASDRTLASRVHDDDRDGARTTTVPGTRARGPVLVVEDDDDIGFELAALLRDEGFAVEVARDGATAWAALRNGLRPSVILLDLMLPQMDGWTLRSKLLGAPPLDAIPIVVLTGAPPEDVARVARVERVLRKPFDFEALLTVVAHHAA